MLSADCAKGVEEDEMIQQTLPFIDEAEATFSNRALKDVTFLGKAEWPIHRWFRLTASFSPFLVRDIITHFNLPAGSCAPAWAIDGQLHRSLF